MSVRITVYYHDSNYYSCVDDIKNRYKECNYDKEFPSECNEFTRTVEIHFEKEDTKPILTKISFPFDPRVSCLINFTFCNYY